MLLPDLHLHTTSSDGVLPPEGVVLRARERGVTLLAVTDHDTLGGIDRAREAAQANGLGFIAGVEISAGGDEEVHVLGYGVRADMPALTALLRDMRTERDERAQEIISKLCALGFDMALDDIPAGSNAVRGRGQIARAMVGRGCVRDMTEAFDKYLGVGCPAYVGRKKLPVAHVISLLRDSGAVPVLAHPGLLRMDESHISACLDAWVKAGLMGLEAYHPEHLPSAFARWDACARDRGLLVTGGSDFHDNDDRHADIGAMMAYWQTKNEDAEALLCAIDRARTA